MRKWTELPAPMRKRKIYPYYQKLESRSLSLKIKRSFDITASLLMIIILAPAMAVIGLWIKLDSAGPVIFRQERITQYGRKFNIYKFRTMVANAEKKGSQVTVKGDARVTRSGRLLRKYRLDELPQLFNVFAGDMSFVGTRPEVTCYVRQYKEEMLATLLLPAGITSRASIEYMDEDRLLSEADDADEVYINKILPAKMEYNLKALKEFSIWSDIKTMLDTITAIIR